MPDDADNDAMTEPLAVAESDNVQISTDGDDEEQQIEDSQPEEKLIPEAGGKKTSSDEEDSASDEESSSSDEDSSDDDSSDDESVVEGSSFQPNAGGDQPTGNNGEQLSEYERLRLQRIERNNARLAQLGLLKKKPQGAEKPKAQPPKKVTIAQTKDTGPVRRQPRRSAKSALKPMHFNEEYIMGRTFKGEDKNTQMSNKSLKLLQKKENMQRNVCAICYRCDPIILRCDMCCKPYHEHCHNEADTLPVTIVPSTSTKKSEPETEAEPTLSLQYTIRSRKVIRCGKCEPCLRTDSCGTCIFCLDKPRFGGANKLRKGCVMRKCIGFANSIDAEEDDEADAPETTTSSNAIHEVNDGICTLAKKEGVSILGKEESTRDNEIDSSEDKKDIGSRVYSVWPENNTWYWGIVTDKAKKAGSYNYSVKFDDGDYMEGLSEDQVLSINKYKKVFDADPPPLPTPATESKTDSDMKDEAKEEISSNEEGKNIDTDANNSNDKITDSTDCKPAGDVTVEDEKTPTVDEMKVESIAEKDISNTHVEMDDLDNENGDESDGKAPVDTTTGKDKATADIEDDSSHSDGVNDKISYKESIYRAADEEKKDDIAEKNFGLSVDNNVDTSNNSNDNNNSAPEEQSKSALEPAVSSSSEFGITKGPWVSDEERIRLVLEFKLGPFSSITKFVNAKNEGKTSDDPDWLIYRTFYGWLTKWDDVSEEDFKDGLIVPKLSSYGIRNAEKDYERGFPKIKEKEYHRSAGEGTNRRMLAKYLEPIRPCKSAMYPSVQRILGYSCAMYQSVHVVIGYPLETKASMTVPRHFRCRDCCSINRVQQSVSNESGIRQRLMRCMKCHACTREDCGKCLPCLDKTKFGGRNTMRKSCVMKQCKNMYYKQHTPGNRAQEDSDVCNICRDGGDLILCDGCDRTYHLGCHIPKIDAIPEGDWFCMRCTGKDKMKTSCGNHYGECSVCQNTGDIAMCKGCEKGYHLGCHSPPLETNPRGNWRCTECKKHTRARRRKERAQYRISAAKAATLFQGEHSDICFICFNGGELICCDFCEKSFHLPCHIPPLNAIPSGLWKCCECSAVERKKKSRCGRCEACTRADCGKCEFCLDKPKFGGKNSKKQPCKLRKCMYLDFAGAAPVIVPLRSAAGESSSNKRPRESTTTTTEVDARPNKRRRASVGPSDPKNLQEESALSKENGKIRHKKRKREELSDTSRKKRSKKTEPEQVTVKVRMSTGMILPSEYDNFVKVKVRKSSGMILPSEYAPVVVKMRISSGILLPSVYSDNNETDSTAQGLSKKKSKKKKRSKDSGIASGREKKAPKQTEEADGTLRKRSSKKFAGDTASMKIVKIINSALKDPENSKAQDKACELLRKMSTTAENATKIINLGGIKFIKKAMEEHTDKTIVQAEGCGLLAELIWVDGNNGTKVASEGCIDLVANVMNSYETNTKVQQMGCGVFRALSYDASNKEIILNANGVDVVLSSMKRNSRKTLVLQEGCSFLQNMILLHPETVLTILKRKRGEGDDCLIVPSILEAVENHSDKAVFIESICGFLSNLAVDKNGSFALSQAGAIPILLDLLKNAEGVAVKQAACSSLKHLAMNTKGNKRHITKEGGVQAALEAIRNFAGDPVLQIACIGLLKELASFDDENARLITKEGGVEIVVSAMNEFADLAQLQTAACAALRFFHHNHANTSAAAARSIVQALENHPGELHLYTEACYALLELSEIRRVVPILKEKQTRSLLAVEETEYPEECLAVIDELFDRIK